jgi:hypothetical protein
MNQALYAHMNNKRKMKKKIKNKECLAQAFVGESFWGGTFSDSTFKLLHLF